MTEIARYYWHKTDTRARRLVWSVIHWGLFAWGALSAFGVLTYLIFVASGFNPPA